MKTAYFHRLLLLALVIPAGYLGSPGPLYSGANAPSSERQVYAALPFSCSGCAPSVGNAIGEMFLTRMNQIRNISVADIDHEDPFITNRPFHSHDLPETAQWARKHAVDKVVIGTIQKFETFYIITVSIVDVESECIEFSDSTRANVTRDLIYTLDHFLVNIQRHVLGLSHLAGKTALQLEAVLLRPWNSMGLDRGTGYLYGGRLSFIFRDERIRNFTVTPAISILRATVTQPYLSSCIAVYPELVFGRSFRLNSMLSVHPGSGFGLFITHTSEDYDRIRESGTYQYTRRTTTHPALSARTDLLFSAGDRVMIALSPQTIYAWNPVRPSLLPGISIAIRYTF